MPAKTRDVRHNGKTIRITVPQDDAGREMEELVEALNAIADWASDAGPLAGKGPMAVAEFARAAAKKVS